MARNDTRLTGVIDTLSLGYGVVNRHPWIILIPILLDLFLWLGPQLTIGRLVSQTLGRIAPFRAGEMGFDQAQQRDLVAWFEGVNVLTVLSPSGIGVPSLVASLGVRDPLRTVPLDTWGAAAAIVFGGILVGMLLGSLYYAILAEQVRDGGVSALRLPLRAVKAWLRILLYFVLLGGLLLLFGLPVGFVAAGAALVSQELASLVLSALMMGMVWMGIYLFFVPDAIFMSQVGPLQAIKNSVAIVRFSFWGALGIMILITIVLLGMGQVWELASQHIAGPWGVGVGILGNAYIATGLIAASMCFYRERIEHARQTIGQPSADSAEPPRDQIEPGRSEQKDVG